MSKNKGITITSLTIYVIVATIIVGVLAFLNGQFMKNIRDLTNASNIASEKMNFRSAFINDIKGGNNRVVSYSKNSILLSNDVKYDIRAMDGSKGGPYAVYRNDALIAKNIISSPINGKDSPYFDYDSNREVLTIGLQFSTDKKVTAFDKRYTEQCSYLVGKPYSYYSVANNTSSVGKLTYNSNNAENIVRYQYRPLNGISRILGAIFEAEDLYIKGWATTPTGAIEYTEGQDYSGPDITLYAVWEEKDQFQIIYHSNFDPDVTRTETYNKGTEIHLLGGIWTRAGYSFRGWAETSDGIVKYNSGDQYTENKKAELYANWEKSKSASFVSGKLFNETIKRLAGNASATYETGDTNISAIEWSDTSPAGGISTSVVSTTGSEAPIYAWYQGGKIKLYSEASSTILNEDSSYMFSNLYSLESISLTDDLHVDSSDNVTNMSNMFSSDWNSALAEIDLSGIDTSNVTNMSNMFLGCQSLSAIDVSSLNTNNVTNMSGMFSKCAALQTINLSNFNTSKVTNMSQMFFNCLEATSINVSSFNTAQVTDFSEMFKECFALPNINVSGFDTSNATTMEYMFAHCENITNLNITGFNTSKVTKMNNMFNGCEKLTSIDVSRFNTENVTDMTAMFHSCKAISTIDLSNFDTSKVTSMNSMFAECEDLTSIDVSSFDTSKVTTFEYMFERCSKITSLILTNFDTSVATNMEGMFYGCTMLSNIDISTFDTKRVTTMEQMFRECTNLPVLEISNFDTRSLTNTKEMFYNCANLTTIFATSAFVTTNVTSSGNMFKNCTRLVGGAGTVYDSSKINATYARIDGGTANPGYFTYIDLSLYSAQIGTTYYVTLNDAISAVPTDGVQKTIKLLKDVVEHITVNQGQNIVLNLAGKTLSYNNKVSNTADLNAIIVNKGTLTLNGGTVSNSAGNNVNLIANNGSGVLNIVGGNYTTNGTVGAINNNNVTGTINITGGRIEATGTRQGVYNNGGLINIGGSAYISATSNQRAAVQNQAGTMNITGGTIVSTGFNGLVVTAGTCTIGDNTDDVLKDVPVIQGYGTSSTYIYGVDARVPIYFYDGVLKGKRSAINDNETSIITDLSKYDIVRGVETIDGNEYKTMTLDERGELHVVFTHTGDYAFNGDNILLFDGNNGVPEIKLFDYANQTKDFRITFTVKSFSSTQESQATLVNAKYEDTVTNPKWPGFCLRIRTGSTSLEFSSREHSGVDEYETISNIASGMKIEIAREEGYITLKQNDVPKVRYDYTSFGHYFDTPLSLGASYKDGAPMRYFKGVLSDITIELEE